MRATFLGKDPESIEGESPTLFATDRPKDSRGNYVRLSVFDL